MRIGALVAAVTVLVVWLLRGGIIRLYSRDPAVVIGRCVVCCKMHFTERVRETVLVRAVLENHPEFAGHTVAYGGSQAPTL